MYPSVSIIVHRVILAALAFHIAGCSLINIAYNNADTAIFWYFDDYFEFNGNQRTLFDQGLQRIHVWHRKEELPKYAVICSEAATRVEAGVRAADLEWLEREFRNRFLSLVSYSAADLAAVFVTVQQSQLEFMEKRFAKSNAKFVKEHLAGSVDEREKRRLKDAFARIEDWVGDLHPDQERMALAMLKAMPRMEEHRYAHRLARQQALREILAARLKKDKLEIALRNWLLNWEQGRTPEHDRLWAQWLEQNRHLILRLTATMTPRQRSHVTDKLRSLSEDFRRLYDR